MSLQIAWTSFHNNTTLVKKYLATYHIGHLVEEQREVWVHTGIFTYRSSIVHAVSMIVVYYITGYYLIVVWSSFLPMQLAAIDKDFLKLRSDMEAKVSPLLKWHPW